MLKVSVLLLSAFLYLPGCASEAHAPGPIGGGSKGDRPLPMPGDQCETACKNLIAECSLTSQPSLAQDLCRDDCRASVFSEEELNCLGELSCGQASDRCLSDSDS